MTLEELNRRISEALKLRHTDPVAAATALLALSEAAGELDRRPALLRTLGLVLQTLPSTPATWELRLSVARALTEEEPNNLWNVIILAEAHAAKGEFKEARERCREAESLAHSERESSQIVAARQRIDAEEQKNGGGS